MGCSNKWYHTFSAKFRKKEIAEFVALQRVLDNKVRAYPRRENTAALTDDTSATCRVALVSWPQIELFAHFPGAGEFLAICRTRVVGSICFHDRTVLDAGNAGKGVVATVFIGIVGVKFVRIFVSICRKGSDPLISGNFFFDANVVCQGQQDHLCL